MVAVKTSFVNRIRPQARNLEVTNSSLGIFQGSLAPVSLFGLSKQVGKGRNESASLYVASRNSAIVLGKLAHMGLNSKESREPNSPVRGV